MKKIYLIPVCKIEIFECTDMITSSLESQMDQYDNIVSSNKTGFWG